MAHYSLNQIEESGHQTFALPKAPPDSGFVNPTNYLPQFPGGSIGLTEYIEKNLKYPLVAKQNGIQGRVWVTFTIRKNGKVGNVWVIRGIGAGCDEEAYRLVNTMPSWIPFPQEEKRKKFEFNLPITFRINSSN